MRSRRNGRLNVRRIRMQLIALFSIALFFGAQRSALQAMPPCSERPTVLGSPWVDTDFWCIERVIEVTDAGEFAFTALAAAPDGTLYAARPLSGELYALTDADGDGLPDQAQRAAQGLTLPNGLAYHDGALYISGGPHIYRLYDDEVITLVDDLPAGPGFWTGGLDIGPDGRLYVGIGAPCDLCEPGADRGLILSFALDGSARRVIAEGLRYPADVAWYAEALWTVDTAPDALPEHARFDELNRVTPGSHFGWPYCIGPDHQPGLPGAGFDCSRAQPPDLTFPTHSMPLALAAYTSDTLPTLQNTLLVALGGSYNSVHLQGYRVVAVRFDAAGRPDDYVDVVPRIAETTHFDMTPEQINYLGNGFWPHRPYGLAVSPEGWLYISVGGGRIYALRPR